MAGDTSRGYATDAFGQEEQQPGIGYGRGDSDAEQARLDRLAGYGDDKIGDTGEGEPSELDQLVKHLEELIRQRNEIDIQIAKTNELIGQKVEEASDSQPLKEEEQIVRGTQ